MIFSDEKSLNSSNFPIVLPFGITIVDLVGLINRNLIFEESPSVGVIVLAKCNPVLQKKFIDGSIIPERSFGIVVGVKTKTSLLGGN